MRSSWVAQRAPNPLASVLLRRGDRPRESRVETGRGRVTWLPPRGPPGRGPRGPPEPSRQHGLSTLTSDPGLQSEREDISAHAAAQWVQFADAGQDAQFSPAAQPAGRGLQLLTPQFTLQTPLYRDRCPRTPRLSRCSELPSFPRGPHPGRLLHTLQNPPPISPAGCGLCSSISLRLLARCMSP